MIILSLFIFISHYLAGLSHISSYAIRFVNCFLIFLFLFFYFTWFSSLQRSHNKRKWPQFSHFQILLKLSNDAHGAGTTGSSYGHAESPVEVPNIFPSGVDINGPSRPSPSNLCSVSLILKQDTSGSFHSFFI